MKSVSAMVTHLVTECASEDDSAVAALQSYLARPNICRTLTLDVDMHRAAPRRHGPRGCEPGGRLRTGFTTGI
jgi:hypothetical protein